MKKMVEYIEREALLEKAKELASGSFSTPLIISAIEKTPTADVVEVVRCKECRSYNKRYGECTRYGAHLGENGFCSSGKRKEGAEE